MSEEQKEERGEEYTCEREEAIVPHPLYYARIQITSLPSADCEDNLKFID